MKVFHKKRQPILLFTIILLFCVSFSLVSCNAPGVFQKNATIGATYKKYVVEEQTRATSLALVAPYQFSMATSIKPCDSYEITDADTVARIYEIVDYIEQHSTLAKDQEAAAMSVRAEATAALYMNIDCSTIYFSYDYLDLFRLSVFENIIRISNGAETEVYFETDVNMRAQIDELAALAPTGTLQDSSRYFFIQ